jgi:hypothetical protein
VLVRRGTPAVVAMQYEITDVAAVELSRAFYSSLAEGLAVDAALSEARKAVALSLPGTLEWGTPVLYLRAPDSRIFDIDAATDVTKAANAANASPPPPPLPASTLAGSPSAGPKPSQPLWRRAWVRGAAAVLVVALVGSVVLASRDGDGEPTELGSFDLNVDGVELVTHDVTLPADSVLIVEVEPDGDLDPDLAVTATRRVASRIETTIDGPYNLTYWDGSLDEYASRPGGQVVGRIDQGDVGEREELVVIAPFGGRFDVIVAGAGGTEGSFKLTLRRVKVPFDNGGGDYLGDVVDHEDVARLLDVRSLDEIEEHGGINQPYIPIDKLLTGGTFDDALPDDVTVDDEGESCLEEGALELFTSEELDAITDGTAVPDPELLSRIDQLFSSCDMPLLSGE